MRVFHTPVGLAPSQDAPCVAAADKGYHSREQLKALEDGRIGAAHHDAGVEIDRMLRLVGQIVVPSFILAIRASGSVGLFQSAFDSVLPLRLRSQRARSSALGVSIPLSCASPHIRSSLAARTIVPLARGRRARVGGTILFHGVFQPGGNPRSLPAPENTGDNERPAGDQVCLARAGQARVRQTIGATQVGRQTGHHTRRRRSRYRCHGRRRAVRIQQY